RHFGSATSRTRETDATTAEDRAEDHRIQDTPDHRLTTMGSRYDTPVPGLPVTRVKPPGSETSRVQASARMRAGWGQ
ncbi:MAG: hypothetical protein JWQ68_392, partial [Cryobacterium sp.]|nr:hypothetical protein [Cryobacterium sp.]